MLFVKDLKITDKDSIIRNIGYPIDMTSYALFILISGQ